MSNVDSNNTSHMSVVKIKLFDTCKVLEECVAYVNYYILLIIIIIIITIIA